MWSFNPKKGVKIYFINRFVINFMPAEVPNFGWFNLSPTI
jgi:hypothetical protein